MDYVAGIDGGGSKTAVQVRFLNNTIRASTTIGPLNYNGKAEKKLEETASELRYFLEGIEGKIKDCKSICIATAGVSNPDAVSWLEVMLKSIGISGYVTIVGDEKAAHYGAFEGHSGIVVISGTGSICYGENEKGESWRTGGGGYLIDDEGSGYAIGRDILSSAVRCFDKREKDSILLSLVLEKIQGTKMADIIRYTYQQDFDKAKIAAIAPILLTACEMKDPLAEKIADKASTELVKMICSVASSISMKSGNVALLGGVLKNYKIISDKVVKKLYMLLPEFSICKAAEDSVSGAAKLALQQYKEKEGKSKWQIC